MNGLLGPVTANRNMLAQALRSRQKGPMELKPVTPQGLLDNAAMATSPVPIVGDVLGLAADANRFYNEPESRTPLNFGLAALGLIPFVPPLVSAGLGKFAQSQGKTLSAPSMLGPGKNQAGAIVYHGSPHKFDQFDSSKIGTGEGAQAYGYGLYFAENPAVAKSYTTFDPREWWVGGQKVDPKALKGAEKRAFDIATLAKTNNKDPMEYAAQLMSEGKISLAQYGKVSKFSQAELKDPIGGNLYKVDLPDEAIAKMLDWDKPLSQQSKDVQKSVSSALQSRGITKSVSDYIVANKTGSEALATISRGIYDARLNVPDGKASAEASKLLQGNGLAGIRYLDAGSRGAGEGTRNFVVFPGNEGLLKILSRE